MNFKKIGKFIYCRKYTKMNTIYDIELPDDAQVIKCLGTFTPDGLYRTNKMIVKNPRKLIEEIVMDLYKKSNIPNKTYRDVLLILAIKNFGNVCIQLMRDGVTKNVNIFKTTCLFTD